MIFQRRSAVNNFVVVLGAAVWAEGLPSTTLLRRSLCAVDFAMACNATLIFTGGVGKNPPSEAQVGAGIAINLGLSADRVFLEELSRNTWENLVNAQSIIAQWPSGNVYIVTDRFHALRSWMIARSIGLTAKVISPSGKYPKSRISVYIKGWLREVFAVAVFSVRFLLIEVVKRG
jgi:uncharacterized SAM-binding protein YcdF (DUF218 family)